MPLVIDVTAGGAPTFSDGFERWWALRVPDVYRDADADNGWTLKRFCAGATEDLFATLEVLRDRIDYIAPSDLSGTVIPDTTGENLSLLATDASVVRTGAWNADTGASLTAPTGPSTLTTPVFTEGGTYLFVVHYEAGPDRGIANIFLDDSLLTAVDEYHASVQAATTVPTSISLDHGYHSLRLEWTGTNGGSATSDAVNLAFYTLTNTHAAGSDTSDLVDPVAADDRWLDWLAQLVGQRLPLGLSLGQRRDAVRFASGGLHAGTRTAVAAAAGTVLTGTKFVQVYDHSDDTHAVGSQGEWDVLLVTRASETPAGADPVAAVIALDAKPAGVRLHHRTYDATWAALEAAYPTWAAWEAAGTWQAIEETGLV